MLCYVSDVLLCLLLRIEIILLLSCGNIVEVCIVTYVVSAPSLNTFKGRLEKYCGPLLCSGSECVCTKTSEQPTGHSGLRSKADEEGLKVTVTERLRTVQEGCIFG